MQNTKTNNFDTSRLTAFVTTIHANKIILFIVIVLKAA